MLDKIYDTDLGAKEYELDKLEVRLKNILDSYSDFVDGIVTYANDDFNRVKLITDFLNRNVQCTSSDVIEFTFDQPDFAANASIDN